jgi:hypothetical protein
MAKVYGMKDGLTTGGLPRYRDIKQSLQGGDALTPDKNQTRSGRGALTGLAIARQATIKPSGDSGSVGPALPLKTNRGGKEQSTSDNPILRATKRTKPNN